MKKYIILLAFLSMSFVARSQQLKDIYAEKQVQLIPDTEFASGNDWDRVFASYTDMMGSTHIGARKSMVILPDGSIVVSHAYRDYYTLFDANGNFVKEFQVTGKSGKRVKKLKHIAGIIGGETLITIADNMGNMRSFDLDGKMVKTLNANYSSRELIVLNDQKIALVGWAIWKEKFRNFVAIIDYETNQEKIIWDHFTDRADCGEKPGLFNYLLVFEKGGRMTINTMPFTKTTGNSYSPRINTVGNTLIVSVPGSGEIMAYDFNGKQISKEKVSWGADMISIQEQKSIQQKYIGKMKERGGSAFVSARVSEAESQRLYAELIDQLEADLQQISEPIQKPYFSTIIKDSDENLLFFEYPEEIGGNVFNVWVYNNGGEYLGKSSFRCDEYDLSISPGKMVFRDGYLYGLQEKKDTEGIPMRLVRFRLE